MGKTMMDRNGAEELDLLRNSPVGISSNEEVAAERERLVPWLEEQIAQLPVQQAEIIQLRRRRIWAGLAAAAAALSVVWFLPHLGTESPRTAENGEPGTPVVTLLAGQLASEDVTILPGSKLGTSSVVRAADEKEAHLRSTQGYEARLAPSAELRLGNPLAPPHRHELQLLRGSVTLAVQPLPPGHTLSVHTQDAQVVVRGTQFTVSLPAETEGSATCVRVQEGAVEVIRKDGSSELLTAGQSSGCAEQIPAPREEGATAQAPSVAPPSRSSPPRSTLAQENQLLRSALAAEREGSYKQAEQSLRTLLKRYPHSSFASEARESLRRIQQKQLDP